MLFRFVAGLLTRLLVLRLHPDPGWRVYPDFPLHPFQTCRHSNSS